MKIGDHEAAGQSHQVRDDAEEEQHHGAGDNAGRDQLLGRIDTHGAHGVDLLGHLHGAQFAGHAAGVAAGDHQAGQHRSQLAHHGERNQLAGQGERAELLQSVGGLQREHGSGEEAGQDHDGQRTHADQVGLHHGVGKVARMRKEIADRAPGQQGIVLHRHNLLFSEFDGRKDGHASFSSSLHANISESAGSAGRCRDFRQASDLVGYRRLRLD